MMPARTAEFVVPALGYWIGIVIGYSESVSLINVNVPTPVMSKFQYAIRVPSGDQRKPSARPNSSS